MTKNELRGNLDTLIFETGNYDSSVHLRTENRNPRSLKIFRNLRGGEGIKKQRDILFSNYAH